MAQAPFKTLGRKASDLTVKISFRIIELFSEGLYSSPHKAIEELVSNSFDAGACNVHVILPPDLAKKSGTIVVIDDGAGMGPTELQQHWLIGESNKRDDTFPAPRGREQIGKFGIGKLATYVLADELTHIARHGGKYYAVTMDYRNVPSGRGLSSEKAMKVAGSLASQLREASANGRGLSQCRS